MSKKAKPQSPQGNDKIELINVLMRECKLNRLEWRLSHDLEHGFVVELSREDDESFENVFHKEIQHALSAAIHLARKLK